MGGCKFIDVLNRLTKSSSDSIDDANKTEFDDFKKYMHVERAAEKDLKDLLRDVNSHDKKTLILLCGSAGDGKSHLLAHLKYDSERLLEGYRIHNDATESNAPHKTAIDTLNEVLSDFNDENLDKEGNNFILAINLGVLANFIESPYGENYQVLKKYVYDADILSSKVNDSRYIPGSHFQHISFSDYQMFLLEKDGINPEYIESLFEKIVAKDGNNPFYDSYNNNCCSSCRDNSKCPIKENYLYFSDEKVRRYIALLIVNVIVREKEILTTRELLNYIHDILVPQDFVIDTYQDSTVNDTKFSENYLRYITPTLLFDWDDISSIMNKTHKYDPLLYRDANADALAIEYYVADNISNIVDKLLVDSPYVELKDKKIIHAINNVKELRQKFFNVLVRMNAISNGIVQDEVFNSYVRYLYNYNSGKIRGFMNLYYDVQNAITSWCGNVSKGNICIDDQHNKFTLYEKIEFKPFTKDIPKERDSEKLNQFCPYIIVEFENLDDEHTKKQESIKLEIDYSLYELLEKLNNGYVQTAEDRNNHADFISFIAKIIKTGSAKKYIMAQSEKGQVAELEKTFGIYKFKVVR